MLWLILPLTINPGPEDLGFRVSVLGSGARLVRAGEVLVPEAACMKMKHGFLGVYMGAPYICKSFRNRTNQGDPVVLIIVPPDRKPDFRKPPIVFDMLLREGRRLGW